MKKILLLLLVSSVSAIAYSGGDGSSGTPYQIATTSDLITLSKTSSDWGKYFIQTADISFDSNELLVDWDGDGTANWDAEDQPGFSPIGNYTSTYFTGNYDGQNHTISNVYIYRGNTDWIGLFGNANSGATIKNLGIVNCNITGKDNVGGLGGYIFNVPVAHSYSTGVIKGNDNVGGLIGRKDGGSVSNSYSTCSVEGNTLVGGFVGYLNLSTINNCYSTGTVIATDVVGGFEGYLYDYGSNYTRVSNCYSLGDVTCVSGSTGYTLGSFCGGNSTGTIENSYSIGKVFFADDMNPTDKGFLGGDDGGTYTNDFFDSEASNQSTDYYATAKTTDEMKGITPGNDLVSDWGWDGSIWERIGNNYPNLISNSNSALPVELNTFTINYIDGKVVLNWQTATEVNNYGFEIQRLAVSGELLVNSSVLNANSWTAIGFVKGSGNSNSPKSYSFVDNLTLDPTLALDHLQYCLKQLDFDGQYEYSDVVEVTIETPAKFSLEQNFPNPFNPSTVIRYQISELSNVSLKVYDILGREVVTLVNEQKAPGNYEVNFDGSNLANSIYIYQLKAGNYIQTKKNYY